MSDASPDGRRSEKSMQLWSMIAFALVISSLLIVWRSSSQRKAAAQTERYLALQRQKAYTATAFRCTVQFPNGYAHRVTSYDPFEFRGQRAELATCDDSVDGEVWAEFYALPGNDDTAPLLKDAFADETHRLVRQRLAFLFDYALPSDVEQLHGKIQVLGQAEKDGWQVRLSYLPTPHGAAQVSPLSVPRQELRQEDVVAQLPMFGIPSGNVSPLVWVGIDDFRNQAERDAFRRAERHALEKLKDQQREYQKAKERFLRMHRHFYLVEAAKAVSPGQVVILRRFGSIMDQKTPQSAAEIIQQMMASLRCDGVGSGR